MDGIDGFHDCGDCGKRTDELTICIYPDGEEIRLCPDCIKDSGFCLSCGYYSSGLESFDFSEMPGYCRDCIEEIESESWEFEYCGDCDCPDACEDFGCFKKNK